MGAIINVLKDVLNDIEDEDRRRKAKEALERVEELYYDGRTVVNNYDAFFMALGVVLLYAIPVWPFHVGDLASALGVDLKSLNADLDHFAWFPG